MRKHHKKNERIKRKYLCYLEEAKRCSVKTTDQVAAAIATFEESTKWKDFAAFHIEQAKAFKRQLERSTNSRTGKPLAKATVHIRLMHVKAFFHWLAGQPGYKSRISYSDSEYFNPSANDSRVATAKRDRPVPSLDQVHHVINNMPHENMIQKRDRAIIAFALLSGARDDAIASFSLKHVNIAAKEIYQDARDVRTKNRKTFKTDFFPVGDSNEAIVAEWIESLKADCLFGPDDPLFPATEVGINSERRFAVQGLSRRHWKNANAIRRIFKDAFETAGLPYANPHLIRKTLTDLGSKICKTPQEFKAWSQNLGHEDVLTTFRSYGEVGRGDQADIFEELRNGFRQDPTQLEPTELETLRGILNRASGKRQS